MIATKAQAKSGRDDRRADTYDPHFPQPRPQAGARAASQGDRGAVYDPHFPPRAQR